MPRPWIVLIDREVRGRFSTRQHAEVEEERLRRIAAKRGWCPLSDVVHADWPSCAWLKDER
jgi:hypothetical protein